MDAATLVGGFASVASIVSYAPQAYRIIKTRDTKGLSPVAYALTVCAFALWAGYGVLIGSWPITVTNAICLVFASFILTMKLLPRRKRDEVADVLDPAVDS